MAYQCARRACDVAPKNSYMWSNLGMFEDQLYRFKESEASFKRAVETANGSSHALGAAYLNWGCMLVNAGEWERAEAITREALKLRPDSPKAQANLGMTLLARGKWDEGWPLYDAVIGFDKSRRKVQYAKEPVWDGTHGQRVVCYGEQGIGDEITFASMIPDLQRVSKSVVLDCTDRLAGLFRRSFPGVTVYGTRWEKNLGWDREHTEVDASISIGGLGKYFRRSEQEFRGGEPYLVADPERERMWRALFEHQRPVIGIAWTGGVAWTADRYRKITLEQLLPLFRAFPRARFISLQYKDAGNEIAAFKSKYPDIDLRQYAYATLTQDYDDTAALVAALDCVVAPPTSVVHLAGALGVPCVAMHSSLDCWKFASGLKFHQTSMHMVKHGKNWDDTIAQAVPVVQKVIG